MFQPRSEILSWAEQGRIAPRDLRPALELAAILPGAAQWRRFLERLLLFMGAVMLCAGVVFFFAYNWHELDRLAKFALVEAALAAALWLVWRLGLERASGKAALLAAALLTGALLALVGQVYQTGADTFELFAAWAAAILPWALLARFPVLWLLWLALVNLAITLYFQTFHSWLGVAFGPERQLWVLFAFNTLALALWEAAAAAGVKWLSERRSVRLLATASGAFATTLALVAIFGFGEYSAWGIVAWLAWVAAAYASYRHRLRDLYVLAGGALSVIVVAAAFLGQHSPMHDAGSFLFIGLAVIAMSAAAGYWLRSVSAEEDR
jgi:uncharacterized membrane protein